MSEFVYDEIRTIVNKNVVGFIKSNSSDLMVRSLFDLIMVRPLTMQEKTWRITLANALVDGEKATTEQAVIGGLIQRITYEVLNFLTFRYDSNAVLSYRDTLGTIVDGCMESDLISEDISKRVNAEDIKDPYISTCYFMSLSLYELSSDYNSSLVDVDGDLMHIKVDQTGSVVK